MPKIVKTDFKIADLNSWLVLFLMKNTFSNYNISTKVMIKNMINKINKVEEIAQRSKIGRLLNNPMKYAYAILFRELIYPINKKEKVVETTLFYGKKMKIALPAATDIYLTGGKSHSSEIRLAKFLINNLKPDDHFLDIGAHYGYFTLIGSELVGEKGVVISFEPSNKNRSVLTINTIKLKNTTIYKKAMSNSTENIIFYEFQNLQSEYNTANVAQFENEQWFRDAPPTKIEVEATTIDLFTQQTQFTPKVIKIDVEGAEEKVIQGGIHYFTSHAPKIVMEYLEPKRENKNHKKAEELLVKLGYLANIITSDGLLKNINDIDNYLLSKNLESDNIVFIKK